MPLGNIPMPPMPEPRYGGTLEILLEGEWRAVYVDEEPVPEGLPERYAYALVVHGEHGYVTERDGERGWRVVEGETEEGESGEAFARRAALERTGATVGRTLLIGYLHCEAIDPDKRPTGERAARPLYVAVAEEVGPVPEGSGWHRRRLRLTDFQKEVRLRYPSLWRYFSRGLDRYLILQRTGQLAG